MARELIRQKWWIYIRRPLFDINEEEWMLGRVA
jgi:hypothetical protein